MPLPKDTAFLYCCDLERSLKCLTALDTCLESSTFTFGHCCMLCWLNKSGMASEDPILLL